MPADYFKEVNKLVEKYRDRCLWFLSQGYTPDTPEEAMQTLELIQRYGDRDAFKDAERLKKWLQHSFKQDS